MKKKRVWRLPEASTVGPIVEFPREFDRIQAHLPLAPEVEIVHRPPQRLPLPEPETSERATRKKEGRRFFLEGAIHTVGVTVENPIVYNFIPGLTPPEQIAAMIAASTLPTLEPRSVKDAALDAEKAHANNLLSSDAPAADKPN